MWLRIEKTLALLHISTVVEMDRSTGTNVFRMETHMKQYLNFSSNHPLKHKRGVVRTLLHIVESIVSNEQEDRKRRITSGMSS